MKGYLSRFLTSHDIPVGVRILTLATSIRWIGWGFAESLIPVFLFTLAQSHADAGILKSFYDLSFIIALPLIGVLADRMRGTTLVMMGMVLYLFVGTGYLLAGLTGYVVFVIIARLINGVGYAFDSIGRETYFRRHTPKEKLATAFGYFDSVADFWWIVAALFGILLVKFVPIHWLLFLITPTVVIAMLIVGGFRSKEPKVIPLGKAETIRFRDIPREFMSWNWKLKLIAAFNFFSSFISAIVGFFLPIQVFTEGAGYTPVIIMGVVMTIPTLMGWMLGDLFDKQGIKIFGYSLIVLAILLAGLGAVTGYGWQIAIGFFIGIIIELLWIGSEELMTLQSKPAHFGRMDGIIRSIADVGSMTGPLIAGIIIDRFGNGRMYTILSILVGVLAIVFFIGRRYLKRN